MINSNLPLSQRANLTEKFLARSASVGNPVDVANAYDTALDSLVPERGNSPERELLEGVRSSLRFTGQNWMCASREVNNPAIRTAAFRQTLQVLAQGPISSVPAALAAVIMGTVDRLPEAVGKEAAPFIQTHLLDDSSKYLQQKGDENAKFLMQLADRTSEETDDRSKSRDERHNQLRMDALGLIATLESPPPAV